MIYLATRHSYREMPLRIAEYGQDYRYEASGGSPADACARLLHERRSHLLPLRPGQGRVIKVMRLHARYYDLMNIKIIICGCRCPISTARQVCRPAEKWIAALDIIRAR